MKTLNFTALEPIQQIRKNTFFDDGSVYCIGHEATPGCYWLFDRDETILRNLIHITEEYGTLYLDKGKIILPTVKDDVTKTALRQYLCSQYESKPLEKIRTGKVMLREQPLDGITDLTRDNIYFTGSIIADNATRKVAKVGHLIKYSAHASGFIVYFTYSDLLFQVLCRGDITPSPLPDGRIQIKSKEGVFYFHDLAIACYQKQIASVDTALADLKQFTDWKRYNGELEVDHADSHKRNNTRYNLSLMSNNLNRQKSALVERFIYPYRLNVVYLQQGHYLLELGYCTDIGDDSNYKGMNFIADSPDQFIKYIKEVYRNKKRWGKLLTPYEYWSQNKKGRIWPAETEDARVRESIQWQERLAERFVSEIEPA